MHISKDGVGNRYSTLAQMMEFDHVIRVHSDGTISEPDGVWAPGVYENGGQAWIEPAESGWSLLNGYSGQQGYAGPVMHPSEFIGGRMEQDIITTPGYYVAVVVYDLDNATEDETPDAGWAVAYRLTDDIPHADYPHDPGRLYDCAACESQCFCKPGETECVYCAGQTESTYHDTMTTDINVD